MSMRGATVVGSGAAALALSTAFPIVASLLPEGAAPRWVGIVDVALAFAVVALALWIDVRARGLARDEVVRTSYRFYRAFAAVPLVLLVIFFLRGDAVRWEVLLPGLAWRTWILLYVFPGAYALWVREPGANL